MDGFIKIYRKIKDWQHFQEPSVLLVWIDLLVSANFKRGYFQGISVPKGSLITSYRKLSEETGLSVNTIKVCISKLVCSGEIAVKSAKGQFTQITINQYDKYQGVSMVDTPTDTPTDTLTDTPTDTLTDYNRRKKRRIRKKEDNIDNDIAFATSSTPTNEHTLILQNCDNALENDFKPEISPKQSAEDKLLRNKKNCEKRAKEFAETLRPFLAEYGREMLNDFYFYWTEVNKSGTKMKFEMEKTWDVSRRLKRWQKNDFNNKNNTNNPKNHQNGTKRNEGLSDEEVMQAVAGGIGLYLADKNREKPTN